MLFAFLLSVQLFSQDPINVLFIGNSLTNGNSTNETDATAGDTYPTESCGTSMPYEFIHISESAGFNVHVEMYAPNGKYVHDDPNNSSNIGHCNSSITESIINSRQWDYVVVQDNAGAYMWGEGYMASFVPTAQKTLHDKIIANNPCTREILYSTQGYIDGLPPDYWHYNGLDLSSDDNVDSGIRSYKNHKFINNYYPIGIVAPAGLAWNRYCTDGHSKYDLYYDTAHPKDKASYLNAAVIFATIFKMDPSGITYTGGYSDAAYLRQIAYETVMDNTIFSETRLDLFTPTISQTGNVLSVDNAFSSYQWWEEASAISGANSQNLTLDHTGLYSVVVEDASGCWDRSATYEYDFTTSVKELTSSMLNVYPNPASYQVTVNKPIDVQQIQIVDVTGKLIKQIFSDNKQVTIDVSDFNTGIYYVKAGSQITKLVVE